MDYFVSLTGSDTNSGTSESQAFRTLAALRRIPAGSNIATLMPGTWRERLPLASGLTVRAKEPGKSIVEGGIPSQLPWTRGPEGIWRATWPGTPPMGLFFGAYEQNGAYTCAYDGRYAQFDPARPGGKVIAGSKAQWNHANGVIQLTSISGGDPNADSLVIATGDGAIILDGLSDVHLDGLVTRYWRYSVGSKGGKNITLTNCQFGYAAQTSVWLTGIDGVEVTGCRVLGGGSLQAHAEDCLHLDGGRAKLVGNEVAWGGHGLAFCDHSGAFTFSDNHLHDSGGSGITAARGVNDLIIDGNWIERCATQRSPSVRDVGAALQLHGDQHQVVNNHLEKNSKHVLLQSEGQGNPSSSDCLFDRNTLLDAEESAVEYQENLPGGVIRNNDWKDSIISGAAAVDLLSLWWAVDKSRAQTNQFFGCQINRGRIRGTLGTFSTVEEAARASAGVYNSCSSNPIPGAGSSLTAPPVTAGGSGGGSGGGGTGGGGTPLKPRLDRLTPSAGPPGTKVTAEGVGFGVQAPVIVSVTVKPETPEGKRRMTGVGSDTSVSYMVPMDAVTGDVQVRRGTVLSNALPFDVTGSTPPPANKPPVAVHGGPYTGIVGQPVQFDGSGSFDLDGTIAAYLWRVSDGSLPAMGVNPKLTFIAPGTYTVTLTVTDNQGATHTATTTAMITAAPPPPVGTLRVSLAAAASGNGATFTGTVVDSKALPPGSTIRVIATLPPPDGRTAEATWIAPGTVPPPPPVDLPPEVVEAIRIHNAMRAAGGLQPLQMRALAIDASGEIGDAWVSSEVLAATGPLTENAKLTTASRDYANRMLKEGFFSHTSPDGKGPGDRIAAAGYHPNSTWGENIAKGFSNAESVMLAWKNSPGHLANILNPGFREIGIWQAGTVWVADFAG